MTAKPTWVASLYVLPGMEARFEMFEQLAESILRDHGGSILRRTRLEESGQGTRTPFEVHVIQFPSEAAFEAYRADARLLAAAELRRQAICRTEVERLHPPLHEKPQ